MSGFTRRDFLRSLGVGLAVSAAPWGSLRLLALAGAQEETAPALWGRALLASSVRDAAGAVVRPLFPDEVLSIAGADAVSWHVPGGRVARAVLQPIALSTGEWRMAPAVGEYVQVIRPYAVVQRWCAHDAPQAARLGWGAVARVTDMMAYHGQDWLGVSVRDGELLGWSLVEAWQGVSALPGARAGSLRLNRARHELALVAGGEALLTAPVALPGELAAGRYSLAAASPVGESREPGAPWQFDFGTWRLHGAYWHNRMADADYAPARGAAEVTVLAAQAIYQYGAVEAEVI